MGIRTLIVSEPDIDGDPEVKGAVLLDSVHGWVFGPLWASEDEIEDFLSWHTEQGGHDLREYAPNDLDALQKVFRQHQRRTCKPAPLEWHPLELSNSVVSALKAAGKPLYRVLDDGVEYRAETYEPSLRSYVALEPMYSLQDAQNLCGRHFQWVHQEGKTW